jgi:hypothetical protein
MISLLLGPSIILDRNIMKFRQDNDRQEISHDTVIKRSQPPPSRGMLAITQIYWPESLLEQEQRGYLIGWNLDHYNCCITNFIPFENQNYSQLKQSLQQIKTRNSFKSCSKDGMSPILLGEWIPHLAIDPIPSLQFQQASIWLTLTLTIRDHFTLPIVSSLYSCGYRLRTSCHMIQYQPLPSKSLHCYLYHNLDEELTAAPTAAATTTTATGRSTLLSTDLAYALSQINNAGNVQSFLVTASKDSPRDLNRSLEQIGSEESWATPTPPSFFLRILSMLTSVVWLWFIILGHIKAQLEKPVLSTIFFSTLLHLLSPITRPLFDHFPLLYSLCIDTDADISSSSSSSYLSSTLKDISITAAYISERIDLLLLCLLTCQHFSLYRMTSHLPNRQKEWIVLNSRLLFLVFDVFFGCCCGSLIWSSRTDLFHSLHTFGCYVESSLVFHALVLIQQAPYGLKFNPLLTERVSDLFILLIATVSKWYATFSPQFESFILLLICCVACFGLSVALVLVVDMIRLMTIHIALIHRLLSIFHSFQVTTLISLLRLFQGKKLNILRARVDTLDSHHSQLFCGIVLFTVFFFLFPTFAVYYYLFTVLQLSIVLCQSLLWSVTVTLKEFAWYEVFKSVSDRKFITSGVYLTAVLEMDQKVISRVVVINGGRDLSIQRKRKKRSSKSDADEREVLSFTAPPLEGTRTERSEQGHRVRFAEEIEIVETRPSPPSLSPSPSPIAPKGSLLESGAEIAPDDLLTSLWSTPTADANETEAMDLDEGEARSASSLFLTGNDSDEETQSQSFKPTESLENKSHVDIELSSPHASSSDENHDLIPPKNLLPALKSRRPGSRGQRRQLSTPITRSSPSHLRSLPNGFHVAPITLPQQSVPSSSLHSSKPQSPVDSQVPTTYLHLHPRPVSPFHLAWKPYVPYVRYWFQRDLALRLLRGIVSGHPPLDLQLIRASLEISSITGTDEKSYAARSRVRKVSDTPTMIDEDILPTMTTTMRLTHDRDFDHPSELLEREQPDQPSIEITSTSTIDSTAHDSDSSSHTPLDLQQNSNIQTFDLRNGHTVWRILSRMTSQLWSSSFSSSEDLPVMERQIFCIFLVTLTIYASVVLVSFTILMMSILSPLLPMVTMSTLSMTPSLQSLTLTTETDQHHNYTETLPLPTLASLIQPSLPTLLRQLIF